MYPQFALLFVFLAPVEGRDIGPSSTEDEPSGGSEKEDAEAWIPMAIGGGGGFAFVSAAVIIGVLIVRKRRRTKRIYGAGAPVYRKKGIDDDVNNDSESTNSGASGKR